MAKKQYSMDELLIGIRTASLTLEVLNFLIKQKEEEKEWLQNQVKQLKLKENE